MKLSSNKIQNQHKRISYLAGLIIIGNIAWFGALPHGHFSAACLAAHSNIINGKTPDDLDDSTCSESDLREYVQQAKKVISNKWLPLKGFEDRSAVAMFAVGEKGTIEEARIVESSGSQAVDQSALDALKLASPLPPLPKGAPESIQIRYVFSWHVTHRYDRSEALRPGANPD